MDSDTIDTYIKSYNTNIIVDFSPFDGNIQLSDNGDGNTYISKWNIPDIPIPTFDMLSKISKNDLKKSKIQKNLKNLKKESWYKYFEVFYNLNSKKDTFETFCTEIIKNELEK